MQMQDGEESSTADDRSLLTQTVGFLLFLLKVKLKRFAFAVVPILALLSGLIMLATKTLPAHKWTGEPEFYRTSDWASSGYKILIDRSASAEKQALLDMAAKWGVSSSDWLVDCQSELDCSTKLIGESNPNVIGYVRFASSAQPVVECFEAKSSVLTCAFVYQLVTQSILLNASPSTIFKNVELFQARMVSNTSSLTADPFPSLSKSVCRDWISVGLFQETFTDVVDTNLMLSILTVSVYFLVTTMYCINVMKGNGFLQQMFRNGMSVFAYWTVVWLVTIMECVIFAAILTMAYPLHCPGVFPAAQLMNVFAMALLTFLTLAVFGFLMVTLLQTFGGLSVAQIAFTYVFVTHANSTKKDLHDGSYFALYRLPAASFIYFTQEMLLKDYMLKLGMSETQTDIGKYPEFFRIIVKVTLAVVVLLALLTIYLDFLLRNGNGFQLPPTFFLLGSFWCPSQRRSDRCSSAGEDEPNSEPVVGFPLSIEAQDLHMTYEDDRCFSCCCRKPSVKVLNGFSCKIYSGQITAIIGHNGAGKSTILNILMGHVTPTIGTAVINGIEVTDPMRRLALRGKLGVCEQSNVLSDALTVMDCIKMTLMSRGSSLEDEGDWARDLLGRLGLADKENVLSCELSGGQMRKVCTILSLLGDPEVVFLDEPTSGLDPVSRRQLWQVLQEQKVGRTIILCTQFMDEADILADRKIMISDGELVCAGSSLFLKKSFGCAFTLDVSLKSASDAPKLLSSIRGARVKSQTQTNLQLQVPATEPDILVDTVKVLESHADIVAAFGLSQANLDDIFMKMHGVDAKFIKTALRTGNLAALSNSEETHAEAQAGATLSRASQLDSKPLAASIARQFAALLGLNIGRQMATPSGVALRFVVFIVMLVMLFSTLFVDIMLDEMMDRQVQKIKSNSSSAEEVFTFMVLQSGFSEVRRTDASSMMQAVCIADESAVADAVAACKNLAGNNFEVLENLPKPDLASLQDFLSQMKIREKLQKICQTCVILYTNQWNSSRPNNLRTAYIGVLTTSEQVEQYAKLQHVYTLGRTFVRFAKIFGAAGTDKTPVMSAVVPLSKFQNVFFYFVLATMAAVLASFASTVAQDPLKDIDRGIRPHLRVMGMSSIAYWISLYIIHLLQYALCVAVTSATASLIVAHKYRNVYCLLAVALPTLFLGSTVHQLTAYCFASIVRRTRPIVGVLYKVYVIILAFLLPHSGRAAVLVTTWLVPHAAPIAYIKFSLTMAFYRMKYYELQNIDKVEGLYPAIWSQEYIRHSLLAMVLQVPFLILVIAIADNRDIIADRLSQLIFSGGPPSKDPSADGGAWEDPGALTETQRIKQSARSPDNILEVSELQKTHPNGVKAVRGISFGAKAGEVLGLLGPNGAGKSTTMSVIVGQELATEGEVEVLGSDGDWVSGSRGASSGAIGYCPQHNPLFLKMTVEGHLEFYAKLRGIPTSLIKKQSADLMKGLGLTPHQLKMAGQLSGGNKRRLCLAMALLGDPSLVVIDEASTGVDPGNKRFIWSAIRCMVHDRRSVLVTTHSMEEVEALCNRVGIMSRGRMVAFGTVQQLRSQYGDAYTLDVLIPASSLQAAQSIKSSIFAAISRRFPGAQVSYDLVLSAQYRVPKKTAGQLSQALKWLNENHKQLGILYYSFYQMSLDQVFVELVKRSDTSGSAIV